MTTVLQTLAPGDHVVASDDVYGGTFRILDKVFGPMGVTTTWVDMTDPANVRAALGPRTRLVWAETPTNPMLKIVDLAAVAEVAHAAGARLVVDNTFATPALQRPLALGADVVVHSMTKYINGHSDVVGGIVVTSDDALAERLRFYQNAVGAVLSPFDSFLVLRGVKTLPVRMERHCRTAASLADALAERPEVEAVFYPGLAKHPGHAVARRQMQGFGGMMSIVVRGGLPAAKKLLETVRVFTLAESLGGVESLIEHPAIMTHGSMPKAHREAIGIVDGLVRLSVGLEDAQDLLDDLILGLEASGA
jgi:cystathionine beta-lyase/cystathionine gamma-synthase